MSLTDSVKANTDARAVVKHDYSSLAAGYSTTANQKFEVEQQDRVFILSGYLNKSTPETVPSGTVIATLPEAVWPTKDRYIAVPASVLGQAEPFNALFSLRTDGELRLISNIAVSIYAFYFNSTYIK